jgi:hypothetical protein
MDDAGVSVLLGVQHPLGEVLDGTNTAEERVTPHGPAPNRPKHPVKELEALLKDVENQDWRVDKKQRYFRIRCSSDCKCMRWVHLTPSSGTYEKDIRAWLKRRPCWREEGQ